MAVTPLQKDTQCLNTWRDLMNSSSFCELKKKVHDDCSISSFGVQADQEHTINMVSIILTSMNIDELAYLFKGLRLDEEGKHINPLLVPITLKKETRDFVIPSYGDMQMLIFVVNDETYRRCLVPRRYNNILHLISIIKKRISHSIEVPSSNNVVLPKVPIPEIVAPTALFKPTKHYSLVFQVLNNINTYEKWPFVREVYIAMGTERHNHFIRLGYTLCFCYRGYDLDDEGFLREYEAFLEQRKKPNSVEWKSIIGVDVFAKFDAFLTNEFTKYEEYYI